MLKSFKINSSEMSCLLNFDWAKFSCFLNYPTPPKRQLREELAYSVMVKIGLMLGKIWSINLNAALF